MRLIRITCAITTVVKGCLRCDMYWKTAEEGTTCYRLFIGFRRLFMKGIAEALVCVRFNGSAE